MSGSSRGHHQRGRGGGHDYGSGGGRTSGPGYGQSGGRPSGPGQGQGGGRPPQGQSGGPSGAPRDLPVRPQKPQGRIYRSKDVPETSKTVEALEDSLVAATKRSKVKTDFPPRPGYLNLQVGSIKLRVNYFQMTFNNTVLYHYDLAASSEASSSSDGSKEGFTKGFRRRMVAEVLKDRIFDSCIRASDNSKIVVTNRKLTFDGVYKGKVVVPKAGEDSFPSPQTTESIAVRDARARNTICFSIRLVKEHRITELMNYLNSSTPAPPPEDVPVIIQLLNIMLCRGPQADASVVNVGENQFFPLPSSDLREFQDLGGGISAERGYYLSVRPAVGRLLVNLNVKAGAFYNNGNLLEVAKSFGGVNSLNDLSPNGRKDLMAFLNKLSVETHYSLPQDDNGKPIKKGQAIRKVQTIHGFAKDFGNAQTVRFEHPRGSNRMVTVQKYFLDQYNKTLRNPREPLVDVGHGNNHVHIPMELCTVRPGQPLRRMLDAAQTQNMLDFASRPPHMNAASIGGEQDQPGRALQCFKLDRVAQQQSLGGLGITVDQNMITVDARILQPPPLWYKQELETPRKASWNLRNRKFHVGGRFGTMSALYIDLGNDKCTPANGSPREALFNAFYGKLTEYGISTKKLLTARTFNLGPLTKANREAVGKELDNALEVFRAQRLEKPAVLMFILAKADAWLYHLIKLRCDVYMGWHSVCCTGPKFAKASDPLYGNLALKFNIKGGGVNHIIKPTDLVAQFDKSTMLMGIDVTHPSPGSMQDAPSIAAVVASVDVNLAAWPGSVKMQEGRQEMVQAIGAMTKARLTLWVKKNRVPPNKIIIFRDGVSEGQFQLVLDNELQAIRKACDDEYARLGINRPKLTLIVCNKRHNTRAFPTREEDADIDHGHNCKPGTVFDRGITQREYWEFFLQAHGCLQGSAKSARYVVLLDDIGFGKDQIVDFTHRLSYLFNRATKAVSVCPPAYYADLLCERGRTYLHKVMNENAESGVEFEESHTLGWQGDAHEDIKDTTWYI